MNARELKQRRKALRMTQFALAKEAKVSRCKISYFEAEYTPLLKDDFEKIEKVLSEKENYVAKSKKK